MQPKRRVLLLVILGMCAVLGALTSRWWSPLEKTNQRSLSGDCIANLKQIDGAKATWALEQHKVDSDSPRHSDLFGATNYIRDTPVCQGGGQYILGRVDEWPRCSLPGHSLAFGWVEVQDEFGAIIPGARVEVRQGTSFIAGGSTDTNRFIRLAAFQAMQADDWMDGQKQIVVRKAGFQTETRPLSTWPLRVVLKRSHRDDSTVN